MPRSLTAADASSMSAARKRKVGGRPRKETPCKKCGEMCGSLTEARSHCFGQQITKTAQTPAQITETPTDLGRLREALDIFEDQTRETRYEPVDE